MRQIKEAFHKFNLFKIDTKVHLTFYVDRYDEKELAQMLKGFKEDFPHGGVFRSARI
jgi:hypothetical protein